MQGRILLVDDEPYILKILSFKLRQEGLVTVEARSLDEALRCLEKSPVDLALLDVNLGTPLSGFDLARMIRENPRTAALPIIMLTARDFVADIRQGREIGAAGYITKPFSIADVVARIHAILSA